MIILKFSSRFLLLIGILLVSSNLSTGSQFLETLEEFLDTQVNTDILARSKAAGLGLAVADGNGTFIYSKGFGFRDVDANSPATSKSLFGVGSVTKGFTAILAVKILNEKFPELGESVLDIPINTLVESINLTLSDRYRTESTSFRDLLAHRLCVTSHINGITFGAVRDTEEHIYRSRYESEACPFRANFVYNNVMLSLAGHLIGEISGDTYGNLMRKLLDDLGMTDSKLWTLEEDYDTLESVMQPYYMDEEGTLKRATPNVVKQVAIAAPAGALLSSPEDMTKYIYFHLNEGRSVLGNQILSPEAMLWLAKPAMLIDSSTAYGLGLFIDIGSGSSKPNLNHDGYVAPYSSLFTVSRDLNYGIFISTNGPGSAIPQQIQHEFEQMIFQFISQSQGKVYTSQKLGKPFKSYQKSIGDKQNSRKAGKGHIKAVCTLEDVVGSFGHALDGEMSFALDNENGRIAFKYGTWGEGYLIRVDEEDCKFQIEVTTDAVLHVYSAMDGMTVLNTVEFQQAEDGSWDSYVWELTEGETYIYRRNFSVGNLPIIPYDPDSCVAENFYG